MDEICTAHLHRLSKRVQVTDPFIVGDSEWISLKFHGQSFMLHQIVRVFSDHKGPRLIR